MNYLGHFLLASLAPESDREAYIVGGLLGDFVKGPLQTAQPVETAIEDDFREQLINGIALHRHIDARFDRSEGFNIVRQTCQEDLRRYAGIMIDLAFDNLLANQWAELFDDELEEFSRGIVAVLVKHIPLCPARAKRLITVFDEYDLLNRYREKDVVEQTLSRIGLRLNAPRLESASGNLWSIQEALAPKFDSTLASMQDIARAFIASRADPIA